MSKFTKFCAYMSASAVVFMGATQIAHADDAQLLQTSKSLIDAALADDHGYKAVESLTTEVGQRLAGSAAEKRARDWAVANMHQMGLQNIRVEPFQVKYWERNGESAEIISPFPQKLEVTALGGSIGTSKRGVTGEIIRFATFNELLAAEAGNYSDKIIFVDEMMTRTQDGSGYGAANRKRSGAAQEAGRLGAKAAIIRSVGTDHHRFPHTGQMRYKDEYKKVPTAALSAPDADQLTRALKAASAKGDRLIVNLKTDVGILGNRASGNVVGEIPGKSDKIVVIGAHLDSWDLGTGAVDDGAGVGIVLGAAKTILDHMNETGEQPEHTIRVVLYGAEEVGLIGAFAYAQEHADNIDNHIIGAESDFGAGKVYQFQTLFGDETLAKATLFQQALYPLGINPGSNQASGGPDMIPLRAAGMPVATLKQNGWDYFDLHHTPDDTFDKIDPDDLAQNVAAYAVFAWIAANDAEGDYRK